MVIMNTRALVIDDEDAATLPDYAKQNAELIITRSGCVVKNVNGPTGCIRADARPGSRVYLSAINFADREIEFPATKLPMFTKQSELDLYLQQYPGWTSLALVALPDTK